ncbi:MAG: dihydrofolate reductase [Planctomycetaceae bacterium]|nr:dihydrofolate reductase [Planctomycetaceae bacterium]
MISAMSADRVIGSGEGMPWDVPEEYQHFLDTTRDATLILGRRSYEIFGPTLTSARCFVITRQPDQLTPSRTTADDIAVASLQEAIERARAFDRHIYVAGGGQIYRQAISAADGMLLSVIPGDWTGETYFPPIVAEDWRVLLNEDRGSYQLTQYERRR